MTRLSAHLLRLAVLAAGLAALMVATALPSLASSRIKDIADFEGVRANQLVGYGLVVGLNGTGDTLKNAAFTRQSLQSMLERMGVNIRSVDPNTLKTANVAAVMVTATLPPFARQGTNIDVTVSAMGDAQNLMGGTLLVTPLLGADGEVYAVAQGQVAVGGFEAQGEAATVVQGVPTAGRIANGAIVEREVGFELASLDMVTIALRNPDLTTARRMVEAINAFLGQKVAQVRDPGTVSMNPPNNYQGNVVSLMTDIEQLRVNPDQPARVVIDDRNGIIVMGENVRISTVAIAQGNLTISITEDYGVSQPGPFATTGDTAIVPDTAINVDTGENNQLMVMPAGVSIQELVNGLNALGIGPRDMIQILQAIKAAGALQAEIEVL